MSRPFEPDGAPAAVPLQPSSAFLPLVILGLVLVAWFALQVVQLRHDGDSIRDAMGRQDRQVQDAKKLRDALDSIARGTARLAEAGNPGAKTVVDELGKQGIRISASEPAADAPGAARPPGK